MEKTKITATVRKFLFTLSALTLFTTGAEAGVEKPAPLVDAVIGDAVNNRHLVGAVILVSLDGKIVYRRAAGFADREGAVPMRENMLFRLSSVTKAYTTMAVAALLEQGKISLDDPVTKYLPSFTPKMADGTKPVITIAHLLNHSAGLSYGFLQKRDGPYHKAGVSDGLDAAALSLEENLKRIASVPLSYIPGTSWGYSVAGDVLGAVVAAVCEAPFPAAMRALVTKPLRLNDSSFVVANTKKLAVPYMNARPRPVRMGEEAFMPSPPGPGKIHFAPGRAMLANAFASGGAGMTATAKDVLALLECIRKNGAPIASSATMQAISARTVGIGQGVLTPGWAFGPGWAVLEDVVNTPQSVGTISWGGVYGHNWFVDPTKKLSLVMLTNTTPSGLAGPLPDAVRDAVYKSFLSTTAQ